MSASQPRAQRAEQTRRALIDAARSLFVEKGYFGTGTEEIVAAAGVGTRGALYHHFADKEALFRAVLDAVQADLADAISRKVSGDDALAVLRSSLQAFLDCAADRRDVQRILLVDGPAVLGWEAWRAMEAEYGMAAIAAMLQAAIDTEVIDDQPTGPLAHMLLALVDEAALYIANAKQRRTARAEAGIALNRLLDGLRSSTSDGLRSE